jgi:hypothetical protein
VIFIDANKYLELYRIKDPTPLLGAIIEQRERIFVTRQIVDEVARNKLRVAATDLKEQLKHLGQAARDSGAVAEARVMIRAAEAALKTSVPKTLERISRSKDDVSEALASLFAGALAETNDEFERARRRRERGNPPGKPTDPLGDQLTWEQLLTHVAGRSDLWIISGDSDFSVEHAGERFLDPLLYRDLETVLRAAPNVFCFDDIVAGIEHFSITTKTRAVALPGADELKRLREEISNLPVVGSGSVEDVMSIILAADARRRALIASMAADAGNRAWINFYGSDAEKPEDRSE